MAPEIHNNFSYGHKVDVWSTGTIFYEMLTGFNPFTSRNLPELLSKLNNGMYNFPKTVKLSLEGLDFLNCCLQYDVKDRMSWENLSKHSYLLCDWNKVKPEEDNLLVSHI